MPDKVTRRSVAKALGASSILALAGCTSDDGSSEPSDDSSASDADDPDEISTGGKVSYLTAELSPTLDPHRTQGFGTAEMDIPYNGLFSYDQNLDWNMDLATDIIIPDDTTYVFPLRDDITFHDGSQWNASVAKWNFERMLSDYADISNNFDRVSDIEESGEMEITIRLEEPFAPFLDALSSNALFVSRAAIEDEGREDEYMQKNPVGTGPFQFESWDQQSNILTYRSFDDYWRMDDDGNQLPYADEWEFKAIPSANTRFNAFEDEGHLLGSVPSQSIEDARNSERYRVESKLGRSNTIEFLSMNCNKEPFDDPLVREAIYYAIDAEGILGFSQRMRELAGPLPEYNWGNNPNLDAEYDPERAQSLLEEAGMGDGFDFTLTVWNSQPWRRDITTVVQSQLDEVGINAEIETLEVSTVLENVSNGDFEMYNGHWGGGGYIDPYGTLHTLFNSNGQFNYLSNYSSEEIDTLLDEALETTDQDSRQENYQKVEQMLFDAHPQVWYGTADLYVAHWEELHNVFPVAPSGYFPQFEKVWIEEDA